MCRSQERDVSSFDDQRKNMYRVCGKFLRDTLKITSFGLHEWAMHSQVHVENLAHFTPSLMVGDGVKFIHVMVALDGD
jgi:hypothetical protein